MRPAGAPYVSSADWSAAVNFVKFFPLVRLPEFLMGMACGFLFLRSERNPKLALPLVSLGLLGAAATALASKFVPYLMVHTAMSGPAFAALVYGIALEPKWVAWLNNRVAGSVWRCQLQLLPAALVLYLAVLPQHANAGVAQ